MLRSQLFLLLLLSGITISAVISVFSYFVIANYHRHEIRDDVTEEAQRLRQTFSLLMEKNFSLIRLLPHIEPKSSRSGTPYAEFLAAERQIERLRLFDARGNLRLSIARNEKGEWLPVEQQSSKRLPETWRDRLASAHSQSFPVFLDATRPSQTSGAATLYTGGPFPAIDGTSGFIVIDVNFSRLFAKLHPSSQFETALVTHSDLPLACNMTDPQVRQNFLQGTFPAENVFKETLPGNFLDATHLSRVTLDLLLVPKTRHVHDASNLLWMIGGINIVLIPLHFLFAYLISLAYRRLQRKQQLQEQLLVQNAKMAAIGEMISFIAHQWRQPLNALASTLIRLRTDLDFDRLDKTGLTQAIDTQENRLQYLSSTIETFREFYAPAQGTKSFNLAAAVQQVLAFVRPGLSDLNIACRFEDFSDETRVTGNQNELMQVIVNLISNARETLKERHIAGPWIRLDIYPEKERLCLDVADNGGGVTSQPLEKVFLPYFTTRTGTNGTGIGLYISRLIVEQHFKGTLRVRNDASGAVFMLCLPAAAQPPANQSATY